MAINFYVKWVFGLSPVPNKLNPPLLVVGSANIEAKDLGDRELCHSSGSSNIVAGVKKKHTYFDLKKGKMESMKWNQLSSPFCFLEE